jgi:hypothetical protein
MLAAIHASGAEIYYRIGRSWGADTAPPADFDKFANVVKHVAMHYNQGWANGFHYHIRYWEFWNEPDGSFWTSTPEQFYLLYAKTALALKSVEPRTLPRRLYRLLRRAQSAARFLLLAHLRGRLRRPL